MVIKIKRAAVIKIVLLASVILSPLFTATAIGEKTPDFMGKTPPPNQASSQANLSASLKSASKTSPGTAVASSHSGLTSQTSQPTAQPNNNAAASAEASDTGSYSMIDQFTGTSLNSALWEAVSYPKGYRNNEEQDYTPAQVKVANGSLQITASRDQNNAWHSGEVHSKWNYTYGEFEVRLALSTTGQGVWPAAWLMGTTDQWPNNGELDIFENINGAPSVYGTIHGGGTNGHWQIQKSYSAIDVTKYHTYKLIKSPGVISWWIDGVKQSEWLKSQTPAGGVWPFENHSNFGLLNLAIGGNWPGPSSASTPNNITMMVDYFSVKNGS